MIKSIKRQGQTFKVDDKGHELFWKNKDWEPNTYKILATYLKPDKVYVDIGAWIGPTVLFAAQLCKEVHCFEPDPVAFKSLAINVALSAYSNVIINQKAVYSHSGSTWMGVYGQQGDSMSSVLHDKDAFFVGCITLTKYIKDHKLSDLIGFIKIDVEGGEFEILQSEFIQQAKVPLLLSLHPCFIPNFEVTEPLANLISRYNHMFFVNDNYIAEIYLDDLKQLCKDNGVVDIFLFNEPAT